MSDPLDSQQIQTVLAAGEHANGYQDHQRAYDTVFPLVDGGVLVGDDLGRGELIVGEACLGLASYDAAMYYLELAVQHAQGGYRTSAEELLAQLRRIDEAQGVEMDGVDGSDEAEALLRVGEDAIERDDFDAAWHAFSEAYDGLRLSKAQLSRAAVGMAACHVQAGQAAEAEGYLQVAEGQEPAAVQARIDGLRRTIVSLREGQGAVEGGVDRAELDEVNRAAIAATWSHDIDTAYDLFLQMYQSPALPASDRGRVAVNLGVLCLYSHSYDAAHQYLTEAVEIGRPEKVRQANALLQRMAGMDEAADIAATIDLSRDIAEAD